MKTTPKKTDSQRPNPVKIAVEEALLLNILDTLKDSMSYIEEELAHHDLTLGRTTRKNLSYAELMENDIRTSKRVIKDLSDIILPNVKLNRRTWR